MSENQPLFKRVAVIGLGLIGGSLASALKKLKGARLIAPLGCIEVTHAIGRGTMQLLKGSCGSP